MPTFYYTGYNSSTVFMKKLLLLSTFLVASLHAQTYRGLWVDAFHPGFKSPQEVDQLFERAKKAKINALFVQMRARAAAYHTSAIDPPAHDKDPGFDALAYILQKAKGTGIQVHAWMNAHPLWPASSDPPQPDHVVRVHPDWITKNAKGEIAGEVGRGLDFGNPGAADYLWRTYMEVARNYPVDGLHLDFIRFVGPDWGYNEESVRRFNARYGKTGQPDPTDQQWTQWRRDQVTALVRKIYATTASLKWETMVTAALIPWGHPPDDWTQSAAYSRVFQDWQAWLNEGILDLGIPMWYASDKKLPWYLDEWLAWAKDRQGKRELVPGLGCYLNTQDDTMSQIERAGNSFPLGFNLFSYASTSDDGSGIKEFEDSFYDRLGAIDRTPFPPQLPWKVQPKNGSVFGTVLSQDLQWVEELTVWLVDDHGEEMACTTTDGTGFYAFLDVTPGTYRVRLPVDYSPGRTAGTLDVDPGDIHGVLVLRGSATTANSIRGDLTLRFATAQDGDTIVMKNLSVISVNPLVVEESIGGRQIPVEEKDPDKFLHWQVGDVVAVKGIVRAGTIDQATVKILGVGG